MTARPRGVTRRAFIGGAAAGATLLPMPFIQARGYIGTFEVL